MTTLSPPRGGGTLTQFWRLSWLSWHKIFLNFVHFIWDGDVPCPKCHHGEAVFFQMKTTNEDEAMKLIFVCCNQECMHFWPGGNDEMAWLCSSDKGIICDAKFSERSLKTNKTSCKALGAFSIYHICLQKVDYMKINKMLKKLIFKCFDFRKNRIKRLSPKRNHSS